MNFFFLTRCYRPDNIPRIQQNLKEVFAGSAHEYSHCVVVDLTHGAKPHDFNELCNRNTDVLFICQKPANDSQNTFGMDEAVGQFAEAGSYVFVLDDDNLLHPRFLEICEECGGEDAVVFKIEGRPELGNPFSLSGRNNPVGHVDWANFITRAEVMKRLKVTYDFNPPRCEDGVFFSKLMSAGCSIKFVDKVLAYYNRLRSVV